MCVVCVLRVSVVCECVLCVCCCCFEELATLIVESVVTFIVMTRMTLAVAIALTSTNLILDRKSGLYDRTWVAGKCILLLSSLSTCCVHL